MAQKMNTTESKPIPQTPAQRQANKRRRDAEQGIALLSIRAPIRLHAAIRQMVAAWLKTRT